MRFNEHLRSHFGSCRRLAKARDEHRNRDVTLFLIPGEFDIVGVSDGVDAWVSPVAINPFSVNVSRILRDIQEGREPVLEPSLRRRASPYATTPAPTLQKRPSGPTSPVGSPTGRLIPTHEERSQQMLNTALDQQRTLILRRR